MVSFLQFRKFNDMNGNAVISEGGAAGHIFHIFEDKELKFCEIKNIIKSVFSGNIEIREKIDGVNISITWRNGEILLARNKETIKKPLTITKVLEEYSDRIQVREVFISAMEVLQEIFSKIDPGKLDEWFSENKFLSAEVVCPELRNVLDYGSVPMIVPHCLIQYDEFGNRGEEDFKSVKKIVSEIEEIIELYSQKSEEVPEFCRKFRFVTPQILKISDTYEAKNVLKTFSKTFDRFIEVNELVEEMTIRDYLAKCWEKVIRKEFSGISDDEIIGILLDRFVYDKKQVGPKELFSMTADRGFERDKFVRKFNLIQDAEKRINDAAMFPLEVFIGKSYAAFVRTLKGFVSQNPSETMDKLTKELEEAFSRLKSVVSDHNLTNNLKKLEKIGLENISPIEGFVFVHKNRTYKMTGAFAPINQILGKC
jgi:hypothetical protein